MSIHTIESCEAGVLLIVQTGRGAWAREHRFPMPLDEARILRDQLVSSIKAAEESCDPRRNRLKAIEQEVKALQAEAAELKCDLRGL